MASLRICATLVLLASKLHCVLFNIVAAFAFFVGSVLPFFWGFVLLFISKAFSWKKGPELMRKGTQVTGQLVWFFLRPFMRLRVFNKDEARRQAPCIIVANHQSFIDIFLIASQGNNNYSFVTKSWPYRAFFYLEPMMRYAGYIDVEAASPDQVEKRALELLGDGVSLIIFPESKRTRTGDLGKFHVGAFLLACRANVPVVPMIIENSGKLFPVHGKYFTPTHVNVTMADAVYPESFSAEVIPHRAMMRSVREIFVQHFNKHSEEYRA